jgi:16S rRNA (cytosine967-C5)-methyltransferase
MGERRQPAVTRGRRAALSLLQAVERGRRLDVAWEEAAAGLPPADRPWVHEAAFGAVRLRGRLDHLLDLHLDRGLASVPPPLVPVLRLGAYQLLGMDGVPGYAAVSQAVQQAREAAGGGVAGLANAVLRSLEREGGGEGRFPAFADDPEGHLSTWGSHPRWLVRRWIGRYGADAAREIVEGNNRVPPLWLRPLGLSGEDAVTRLAAAGIRSVPGPPSSGTLRLDPGASPRDALDTVPGVIQDPAAAWVVAWVGPVEGKRVVDLCAAPGGKALGLAAGGGRVIAADLSPLRLRRLGRAAARLGLDLPRVVADGAAPPFRSAEVVLVDAPCTGTGTLGRHPDARWRLSEGDIRTLAGIQDRILDGAAEVVAPGGLLVYATCSLEPEENEDRVEAFLRRHQGFIVEGGPGRPGSSPGPEAVLDGPWLRVLPHRTGTDGSFAARLRRRSGEGRTEGSRRTE